MCFVSLKDKQGEEVLHYVVKQAFSMETKRKIQPIRDYYLNEIHFYTVIWPHFQKFHNEKLNGETLNIIPQCFATSSEDKHEKLVLENLKFQGFQMHDKAKPLSKEQVKTICKHYGRFHAISFAYKFFYPVKYSEITSKLQNHWRRVINMESWREFMDKLHDNILEFLDSVNGKVIEKYRNYVKCGIHEKNLYKGHHSVVLHGDGWSNNMMFKYDDSNKLVDLRLLDFQFSMVGTPVSDLSHFIYSGATKEILDDLDHYLRVYHDTLVETLKNFGCDSENLYPFEVLKKHWREYCKTGFALSLSIWRGKLTNQDDIKDLLENSDETFVTNFFKHRYDENSYKKIVKNLILHMYENDFF
ncbi:hypothetical protein NQ317_019067 [Molorchus minor]|uniref:CHK kinase-like domain-containing protein n=1 Tax=Molorchus minor TaxID=1323400 RepID=A0ABQ9J0H3_9CUCU|nr:hypothetical protein NQ317_019067 [Molorchus minor]